MTALKVLHQLANAIYQLTRSSRVKEQEKNFQMFKKVESIKHAITATVRAVTREELWVHYYGAYTIDPKCLVYWICLKTDNEKQRLQADEVLTRRLRDYLIQYDYPPEGRDSVHIGFESQETVDRESDGDWFQHWK